MGNAFSSDGLETGQDVGRQQAVTEARRKVPSARPASELAKKEDWPFIRVRGGAAGLGCRTGFGQVG